MQSMTAAVVLLLSLRTIYSAVILARQADGYEPSDEETNGDSIRQEYLSQGELSALKNGIPAAQDDLKEQLVGTKDVLDYAGNGWKLREIEKDFGLLSMLRKKLRYLKLRYTWVLQRIRSKLQAAQEGTDETSHPCVGSNIESISRHTADKLYKPDDYIRYIANAYGNEDNNLRNFANVYESNVNNLRNFANVYDSENNNLRNLANVYDRENKNLRNLANVYDSENNNLRNGANMFDSENNNLRNLANVYDSENNNFQNLANVYDSENNNLRNLANVYDSEQGDLYAQNDIDYEQINLSDLTNIMPDSKIISALHNTNAAERSSAGLGGFERVTRRGRLHSDSGYGSRIDAAGNLAGGVMAAENIFGMFGPGRKKRQNVAVTGYASSGIVGTKRGGDSFISDYGYGSRMLAGSMIAKYTAARNLFGDHGLGRRR